MHNTLMQKMIDIVLPKSDLFKLIRSEGPQQFNRLVYLSLLVGILNTGIVGLINQAVSEIINGQSVIGLFVLFSTLLLAYFIVTKRSSKENIYSTQRMIYKFKLKIMRDVYNTDLATIDKIGRDRITEVMIRDSQVVSQSLVTIVTSFQSFATLLFLSVYLAIVSFTGFVIIALALGLIAVVAVRFVSKACSKFDDVMKEESRVNLLYSGFLYGFKELKMNSLKAFQITRELMDESNKINYQKSGLIVLVSDFFNGLEAVLFVVVGVMVFVVPMLSSDFAEKISVSATTALFLAGSLTGLITSLPNLTQANAAAKSLCDLAEELEGSSNQSERAGDDRSYISVDNVDSLELCNVSYSHQSLDGSAPFRLGPISYKFECGKVYFIRGNNGSGKTTFIRLLLGLYQPSSGTVVLNGGTVVDMHSQAYRDLFSVVFSDFYLFKKLYGVNELDDSSADKLIELLELQGKVSIHHSAFNTVALSTGQRKRLALIVAILERRQFIVLDEWAADQDPHFRSVFYNHIIPYLKGLGKTIIAVTHDDAYYHCSDELICLNTGLLDHD